MRNPPERVAERTEVSQDVLEGARRGDRGDLATLVETMFPFVRRMLFRLLGASAPIDDVQQEVLVKMVTQIPNFRGDSRLTSWIASICVATVRDQFRSSKRSREREQTLVPAVVEASSVDNQLDAKRRLAQLDRVLQVLPENQRIAIALKTMGHSVEEIAEITNSAQSTTRLRLYWGRKAFQKALGKMLQALEEKR